MDLSTKLEKVKNEDAAQHHVALKQNHESQAYTEAVFILGRIKQNEHIAAGIYNNLSAQSIRALERFQQEKKFHGLGYETFDAFLNNSELSPMSKSQYYERLALVRKLGDDVFDLLTAVGISVNAAKLLESGDIAIKNDAVYVGDRELKSDDTGLLKEALTQIFDERRELRDENTKLKEQNQKQKVRIERGEHEVEEARRALDEVNETTRFERAFMTLTNAFWNLTEVVGELDDSEKAARATRDLKDVAGLYFALSDAYDVKQALTDDRELKFNLSKPVEQMTEAEKRETFLDRATAAVMADDIGDEEGN